MKSRRTLLENAAIYAGEKWPAEGLNPYPSREREVDFRMKSKGLKISDVRNMI
jgi:hypothetical protein